MMKAIYPFAMLLLSIRAHSSPPQQYVPWPLNGTVYLNESECPGTCYPIVDSSGATLDLETVRLAADGSRLEIDPAKRSAKKAGEDAMAAKENALKALRLEVSAFKDKASLSDAERDKVLLYLLRKDLGNQ